MSFPTIFLVFFFSLTLLNVSSLTSNSYIVSINSVRIIINCRAVTIQIKSVSINCRRNTEAALDVFSQDLEI